MPTIKINQEISELSEFKLCFVQNGVAYFTTQEVTSQWGDDWDDISYEHNAGTPYAPAIHYLANGERRLSRQDWNPDGTPKFKLLRVLFDLADYREPSGLKRDNSGLSVWCINKHKGAPWLTKNHWKDGGYEVVGTLFAGATFPEFFEFIKTHHGTVYVPDDGLKAYPLPEPQLSFMA